MKKARNAILAVFLSFICIISGLFIGRVTAHKNILLVNSEKNMPNSSQSDIVTSQDVSVETGRININTASAEQLQILPDIGAVLAERIVTYRTEIGPFSTVDDLTFVDGIGEKRLDKLRQYITVGG